VRNLSVRLLVLASVLSLGLGALSIAQPAPATASSTRIDRLENEIDALRAETWRWQALMRKPRTPSTFSERHAESHGYIKWVHSLWQRRARIAKRQAANPPHRNDWLCIQRHESHPAQGWGTYTGNGYYGGLQMDLGFQRTYGYDLLRRKGTANKWTAVEQMWVAERAYRDGRGFYPWPNTARSCGLI
jgi:Transglycosylase-like domain